MTETESPTNPVKNGPDFSATDFGKLYSRSQYIEKVNESSIPQHDINSSNTNIPSQTQPSEWHDNDSKEKIEQNFQFKTSDEISVEQPKLIEVNDIEIEDNFDDCHCQKISVMPGTAACNNCDRVIPILVDLNRKRLQLLDDLEEANIRKKEGFEKVERQNDEIENLGKRIMELEDQLDSKVDEFSSLQDDMNTLNEKYVKVIDRVAELQHSKDMVESELEELSRSLFEQANGMVASEAKQRHELEIQQKILEKQLLETQERLSAESMQLKELREKMEGQEQPQAESKRSSSSDPSFRASIDFAELFGLREKSPEAAASLPGPTGEDGMGIDTELLAEFKEFVESSMGVRLQRIHTIPFMKHCLEEDVDPCMRFGNNPRVSPRKIIEAIVANTCFIEEAPPGAEKELALNPNSPVRNTAARPALWDRIAGNPTYPRTGCQCCGRPGPLPFQYRITNLDDWSLIDRYCRDRLVAVCEFYVFIRNVRSGLYNNRLISDLYSECLRLRLQMFYARLGALPSMLNTLGIKGTELASAKKPTYMLENPTMINQEEPFSVNMSNEPEEIVAVSPPLRELNLHNSNINQQDTLPKVVVIEPSRPNSSTNIEIENTG
ncbi:8263_t:CDS:1 [Diversispora eburnea]|uniref:8263_t:CDS:1 n=1 Tax=Diversispora eburnea TaxID=1213867 RepID=A0A9N8V6N2_9GLOM|nr:8263_t:CDS:1 [Diversispora eburnea]